MMFKWRKKETAIETTVDNVLRRLGREVWEARDDLVSQVQKTMSAIGVVDLYPEGTDKDKAKKDADKQRSFLLVAIGHYDARQAEYHSYKERHKDDISTSINWADHALTSHEIIEREYRNFYQKNR